MNITDKNGVKRIKDNKGRFARSSSDYKVKYGANNRATILDPENKPVTDVYSYDKEDIKAEIDEDIRRWEEHEQQLKDQHIKGSAKEAVKNSLNDDLIEVDWYIESYKDTGILAGGYQSLEEMEAKKADLQEKIRSTKAHERQLAGLKLKNSWKK